MGDDGGDGETKSVGTIGMETRGEFCGNFCGTDSEEIGLRDTDEAGLLSTRGTTRLTEISTIGCGVGDAGEVGTGEGSTDTGTY